jgi:ABC-type lipoprotein release transport system permease subunit
VEEGLSFGVGICAAMETLPLSDFVPHSIVMDFDYRFLRDSSLITVTAGMYPAQRAADMTPLESQRYE